MTRTVTIALLLFGIVPIGLYGCGVPQAVHCKFVNDVGNASANYGTAASAASNAAWQAEAQQLKTTVDSEKQNYCK